MAVGTTGLDVASESESEKRTHKVSVREVLGSQWYEGGGGGILGVHLG